MTVEPFSHAQWDNELIEWVCSPDKFPAFSSWMARLESDAKFREEFSDWIKSLRESGHLFDASRGAKNLRKSA